MCDRFADRVCVNSDDGVDVRRIAAAHADDNRDVAVAARVEHQAIACAQAVDRQPEAAEPITFVRIGAGQIEDDVRPMRVEDRRQMRAERGQILVVSGAVFEGDVEIARFLAERKILRLRIRGGCSIVTDSSRNAKRVV